MSSQAGIGLPQQVPRGPLRVLRRTKISRTQKGKTTFWQELQMQYHSGKFCDLQLEFQDTSDVILCHKTFLASVSNLIKQAVIMSNDEPGEVTVILVPEADYKSTKEVVDFLYSFLAAGNVPAGYFINKIALDALAIDLTTLGENNQKVVLKQEDPLQMPLSAKRGTKRKRQDESETQSMACQFWSPDDLNITANLFQPHVLLEKLPKYRRKTRVRPKSSKREHVLSLPVVPKMTEEELARLRNPQLCESILCSIMNSQGELDVDLQKEPMRHHWQCFNYSPFKVDHFAILGIKKSNNEYEGISLAHKLKEGEDLFSQFKQTGEALKSVLGLSTRDTFCQPIIPRKLNEYRKNVRGYIRPRYVKDFAHLSDDQLKNILNDPEIVEITERRIPSKILNFCHESIRVCLNKDLKVVDLDHVLMVCVLETGKIKARFLKILDDDIDKTVIQLHRLIFHVWSDNTQVMNEGSRKLQSWTPAPNQTFTSPELKELYYKLLDLCLKADVAQAYLKGELDKEQELNKSVVCPHCGLTFSLSTMRGEARYHVHQRRHYFEDYKCDCGIDFATFEEKKWHVMLHHDTGRKYKKCDFCPYVNNLSKLKMHMQRHHSKDDGSMEQNGLTTSIPNTKLVGNFILCELCNKTYKPSSAHQHFDRMHKSVICPVCGGDFNGTSTLKQHILSQHPTKSEEYYGLSGDNLPSHLCDLCGKDFSDRNGLRSHNLLVHVETSCKICTETFSGQTKLNNHMIKHHRESVACHVCSHCGKKFLNKHAANRHMMQVHNEGNGRKHQCDMCPRTFVFKSDLKNHRIRMHLKTLAYKCRVCEQGFYDSSARFVHEKKQHDFQHKKHRKRDALN